MSAKLRFLSSNSKSIAAAERVLHVSFGSSLCENVRQPTMHRIVFSIFVCQQKSPVQLVSASTKLRQMFYRQIERRSFHTAWVKNGSVRARAARRFYPQVQTSS